MWKSTIKLGNVYAIFRFSKISRLRWKFELPIKKFNHLLITLRKYKLIADLKVNRNVNKPIVSSLSWDDWRNHHFSQLFSARIKGSQIVCNVFILHDFFISVANFRARLVCCLAIAKKWTQNLFKCCLIIGLESIKITPVKS